MVKFTFGSVVKGLDGFGDLLPHLREELVKLADEPGGLTRDKLVDFQVRAGAAAFAPDSTTFNRLMAVAGFNDDVAGTLAKHLPNDQLQAELTQHVDSLVQNNIIDEASAAAFKAKVDDYIQVRQQIVDKLTEDNPDFSPQDILRSADEAMQAGEPAQAAAAPPPTPAAGGSGPWGRQAEQQQAQAQQQAQQQPTPANSQQQQQQQQQANAGGASAPIPPSGLSPARPSFAFRLGYAGAASAYHIANGALISARATGLVASGVWRYSGLGWYFNPILKVASDVTTFATNSITPMGGSYLRRGLSWRYNAHILTEALFSAADALKSTNSARLLIDIDPKYAKSQNFVYRVGEGINVPAKYNLSGAVHDVEKAIKASGGRLGDHIDTLKAAMNDAQSKILEASTRLQKTEALASKSRFYDEQSRFYSTSAQDFIKGDNTNFENTLSALRAEAGKAIGADDFVGAEIFDRAIKGFEAAGTDAGAAATALRGLATELSAHSRGLNDTLSTVRAQTRQVISEQYSILDVMANNSSISGIDTSAKALDENVAHIAKSLSDIESSIPLKDGDPLLGGTVTARLAAYGARPHFAVISEFNANLGAAMHELNQGVNIGSVTRQIDAAAAAEDSILIERMAALSDSLAERAAQLDGLKTDTLQNLIDDAEAASASLKEMEDAVGKHTEVIQDRSNNLFGVDGGRDWRFFTRYGSGAGLVESRVTSERIGLFRSLVAQGEITLPPPPSGMTQRELLNRTVAYTNGEKFGSIATRTADNLGVSMKTEAQKFFEFTLLKHDLKGGGVDRAVDKAIDILKPHPTTGVVDTNRLYESLAWASLNYSRSSTTGKLASGSRDMADFMSAVAKEMAARNRGLAQSGMTPPFPADVIKAVETFSSRIDGLGANALRDQWVRLWDQSRNYRWGGDFNSELAYTPQGLRKQGLTEAEIQQKLAEGRVAKEWNRFSFIDPVGRHGQTTFARIGNTVIPSAFTNPYWEAHFVGRSGKFEWGKAAQTIFYDNWRYSILTPAVLAAAASYGVGISMPNLGIGSLLGGGAPAPQPLTPVQAQAASAANIAAVNASLTGLAGALQPARDKVSKFLVNPGDPMGLATYYRAQIAAGIAESAGNATKIANFVTLDAQLTQMEADYQAKLDADQAALTTFITTYTLPELARLNGLIQNPATPAADLGVHLAEQQRLIQEMNDTVKTVVDGRIAQAVEQFLRGFHESFSAVQLGNPAPATAPTATPLNIPLPGTNIILTSTSPDSNAAIMMATLAATVPTAPQAGVPILTDRDMNANPENEEYARAISARAVQEVSQKTESDGNLLERDAEWLQRFASITATQLEGVGATNPSGADLLARQHNAFITLSLEQLNNAYTSMEQTAEEMRTREASFNQSNYEEKLAAQREDVVEATQTYKTARDLVFSNAATMVDAITRGQPLTQEQLVAMIGNERASVIFAQAPAAPAPAPAASTGAAPAAAATTTSTTGGGAPMTPAEIQAAQTQSATNYEALKDQSLDDGMRIQRIITDLENVYVVQKRAALDAVIATETDAAKNANLTTLRTQLDTEFKQVKDFHAAEFAVFVQNAEQQLQQMRDLETQLATAQDQAAADAILSQQTAIINGWTRTTPGQLASFEAQASTFKSTFDDAITAGTPLSGAQLSAIPAGTVSTPQWQTDLQNIKAQAARLMATAQSDATRVSQYVTNPGETETSQQGIIELLRLMEEGQIARVKTLQDELIAEGEATRAASLDPILAQLDRNTQDARVLIPALESIDNDTQAIFTNAQSLNQRIAALSSQGDLAQARTWLDELTGLQDEIATKKAASRDTLSIAFAKAKDNAITMYGDENDPSRQGNSEIKHKYGWRGQVNDGLIEFGGENGLAYQWFGMDKPGTTNVIGGLFNSASGAVKGFGEWWSETKRRNSGSQNDRNWMNAIENGTLALGSLIGLNFLYKQVFGKESSGIVKWGMIAGIALYFLNRSGETGDQLAKFASNNSTFASAQFGGGGHTPGHTSGEPSQVRVAQAAPDAQSYEFPIRRADGSEDREIFYTRGPSGQAVITAQADGGNLIFLRGAEREIRRNVIGIEAEIRADLADDGKLNGRLAGHGFHVVGELVQGKVNIVLHENNNRQVQHDVVVNIATGEDPRQAITAGMALAS